MYSTPNAGATQSWSVVVSFPRTRTRLGLKQTLTSSTVSSETTMVIPLKAKHKKLKTGKQPVLPGVRTMVLHPNGKVRMEWR